jgi:hypothetical protein
MSLPKPVIDDGSPDAATEIAGDLQRTLARSMDWAVREWRALLAELEKKHAGYVPPGERDDLAQLREFTRSAIDSFERMGEGDPARLDHLAPAEYSWHDITHEMTRDEAAGWALWATVKQTARDELASGAMAARSIEGYHAHPYERAAFLAVREALADGLQPRNGMERLLIDGMAQAWTLHLRWLDKHTNMDSMDAIRHERDMRQRDSWEPPRLTEAEAVHRAVQMADRFQRQFLRLMKCYRDGRRLGVSMTVLGGQVNVAEQQINMARAGDAGPARPD